MATTHNITTTFTGKASEGYLRAALLSGKTLASGDVDIRDNVQHKEVVQLLSSDANLVKPANPTKVVELTLKFVADYNEEILKAQNKILED